MDSRDQTLFLQEAVQAALDSGTPLNLVGGGSKAFYGRPAVGAPLSLNQHQGIINYHPSELVMTARAGTKLADIEQTLAEHRQMLAFEPPHFADTATLGGAIACGLSGPRRPFTGSARDVVLGCKIINGKAEVLSFGGEVMKNVAGYDVSRLMVGAMGCLGLLLDISIKVLPKPDLTAGTCFELTASAALRAMTTLSRQSLPLSGLSYDGRLLYARFSGYESAVRAALQKVGGDTPGSADFWQDLNEQRHAFFQTDSTLWRLAVPPATPELAVPGEWLFDWGGGLRWLTSNAPALKIFAAAGLARGHAVQFRAQDRTGDCFQPLTGKLQQLNRSVKQAFDPDGIFNPNRMYQDW
ncbi:MAG: glycolate oxidase subunit GlcE [Methylovulum sp.]|nr:glycolate oxidase subunit GlcE [Methylovulum sp.]